MIRLSLKQLQRKQGRHGLPKRLGRGSGDTAANVRKRLGDLGRTRKQVHMRPKTWRSVRYVDIDLVRFACMKTQQDIVSPSDVTI
jgi:hypothetical protein